jgi:lipid-binding SYLF domain-containing protein
MKKAVFALLGLVLMAAWAAQPAFAEEPMDEQVTVDKAQIALREFMDDPDMVWMRSGLKECDGVLIIPTLIKAGFLLGGSGGNGVFFARDKNTGEWRGPAFYNLGSVTFGLQIGAEASQVVILAMTDSAVKAMLSPSLKLGGDIGIAVGPVGAGASGAASLPTAPFLSYARSKGAYAGITFEGAVLNTDRGGNTAYYGRDVRTEDILITGYATTDRGAALRSAIAAAARK